MGAYRALSFVKRTSRVGVRIRYGRCLLLFEMQLLRFPVALTTKSYKEECQEYLDQEGRENAQDDGADLGASDRRRHHNGHKPVVDEDHSLLLRMLRVEVVHEPHDRAHKDGEARNGDCGLGVEVEKRNDERDCNATTADAGHGAESHDKRERKDANHLEHRSREHAFVAANSLCFDATDKVASLTIVVGNAGLKDVPGVVLEEVVAVCALVCGVI